MNIGKRIKELRESKQITQSYINNKMNKSTGWLANIEKGRREISARELIEVVKLMNVSMHEFFSFPKAYISQEPDMTSIPGKDVKKTW